MNILYRIIILLFIGTLNLQINGLNLDSWMCQFFGTYLIKMYDSYINKKNIHSKTNCAI